MKKRKEEMAFEAVSYKRNKVTGKRQPRKKSTGQDAGSKKSVETKANKLRIRAAQQPPSKNRGKKRRRKNSLKTKQHLLKEIGIAASLTMTLFLLVFFSTCALPTVNGYSMTPTFNDQDRLIVYKWGEIKRFSLIYLRNPEKKDWLIRRVIGRPGELVEYRKGVLYINGSEVPERFLPSLVEEGTDTPITADFQQAGGKIPNGKYFVLGDNRSYATDSRYFGLVDESEIKGTVVARIFPIHGLRQF